MITHLIILVSHCDLMQFKQGFIYSLFQAQGSFHSLFTGSPFIFLWFLIIKINKKLKTKTVEAPHIPYDVTSWAKISLTKISTTLYVFNVLP